MALKIEQEDFQELLAAEPDLALNIIQVLVQRLDQASQSLATGQPLAVHGIAPDTQ